jgi:hypothetical protein
MPAIAPVRHTWGEWNYRYNIGSIVERRRLCATGGQNPHQATPPRPDNVGRCFEQEKRGGGRPLSATPGRAPAKPSEGQSRSCRGAYHPSRHETSTGDATICAVRYWKVRAKRADPAPWVGSSRAAAIPRPLSVPGCRSNSASEQAHSLPTGPSGLTRSRTP